jgi:hypothetical protein
MMNFKECGKMLPWPYLCYPDIFLERLGQTAKNSVRIAGLRADTVLYSGEKKALTLAVLTHAEVRWQSICD